MVTETMIGKPAQAMLPGGLTEQGACRQTAEVDECRKSGGVGQSGQRADAGGCGAEAGVVERRVESAKAKSRNKELGRRGEEAAARFLERKGFEILERNWACHAGEADIIAQDEDTLVFVEVKTRSNADKGLPEEAVDKHKRERYERIAAAFLQTYETVDIAVRFDVVSILVIGSERAFLRHHINAFSVGR